MKYILSVLVFSVSLFSVFPILAFSQETQKIDENFDNIAIQYAECAAYYEFVFNAMKESNENKTADTYRQLESDAMFYSFLLANESRSKDLATEVTIARIDIYKKKMKHETDNRNENISILINKYHFECQKLMQNPPTELRQVLKGKIVEGFNK